MSATTQPARQILRDQYLTITDAADRIGVPQGHLRAVLAGTVAPQRTVRERLPELLGVPLEDLFTQDLLAREWTGPRRSRS